MHDQDKSREQLLHELVELRRQLQQTQQEHARLRQAEQQLQHSEQRFRMLAENIPGVVYLCRNDEHYTMLYLNPAVKELTGYAAEQFIEQRVTYASLIHPDDLPGVVSKINQSLMENRRFELNYRLRQHNGQWRHVHEAGVGVFEDGQLLYLEGYISDVTKQQQAQEALEQSESRWRSLVENAPSFITVFDHDGNIQFLNRLSAAFEAEGSITGKSIFEFVPPHQREFVRQMAQKVFLGETVSYEIADTHGAYYSARIAPIWRDGKVVSAISVAHDISDRRRAEQALQEAYDKQEKRIEERTNKLRMTNQLLESQIAERRRTEEALRESESRYRLVFDNAPIGIVSVGPDGKLLHTNRELQQMLGYTHEELTQKSFLDITHPDDIPQSLRWMSNLVTGTHDHMVAEKRYVRKDGSSFWALLSVSVVRDEQRRLKQTVSIIHDITERKLAAQQVIEAQQRLQAVFDHSSSVMYIKDTQGRFLMINRQFEQLFGMRSEQVAGKTDHEVFDKVFADRFHENDLHVIRRKTAVQFEETAPHSDGPHTYLSAKFPLVDAAGEIYAVCGISTDITDRKRTEENLRIHQRAVASSINGVLITDANQPDNPIVYVNPAFERITGYTAQEAIGRNCRFLQGHDRDQPELDVLRQCIREQREVSVVLRNYRKDGRRIYLQLLISPVRDETGRVTHFVGVQHDITQRLHAEQALRESELRFRNLVFNSSDIITLLDADMSIRYESPSIQRLLGYDPQELVGRYAGEFIHPDDLDTVRQAFERCLDQPGVNVSVEYRWRRPDGTWVHLEAIGNNKLDDPAVRGIVVNSRDITERLQAEQRDRQWRDEMAHAARVNTMGEMASGLAHELNQPLTAVVNYVEACLRRLRAGKSVPAELLDDLERANDQAVRAGEIIRHLKNFMRRREPQRTTCDINKIIREAVTLAQVETRPQQVAVELNLHEPLPALRTDRIQIQQVVLNLVRNAAQAMTGVPPHRRRLIIASRAVENDMVEVSVCDEGTGVAKEILDKVFEPFFSTKRQGMGMGLAICRSIVQSHGGDIRVSLNNDHGSTFTFTLPVEDENSSGRSAGPAKTIE